MKKILWITLMSSALLVACKPTPRTATEGRKDEVKPAQLPEEPANALPPQEATPVGLLDISTSRQEHNRLRPWEKQNVSTMRSMGVYLGNGRVLTVARAALYATYVELSLPDHSRTAPAHVVRYDAELGLALLTVEHAEDISIFDNMAAHSIGEPLTVGSKAELCTTVRGITPVRVGVEVESVDEEDAEELPRLEMRSSKPLPAGMAAGLPIIRDGRIVALVDEYSTHDQSLSCINAEFINRFLDEVGSAEGNVPMLGVSFAELDDPVFSKYLKLSPGQGGVYVSDVAPGSAAQAAGVKKGDVITSIDGLPLDKLGRCQHPLYGLMNARSVIRSLKPVGQSISLGISRNGESLELQLELNREAIKNAVVGVERAGDAPRYIMWGGLLFQPVTVTYLEALERTTGGTLPLPLLQLKERLDALYKEGIKEVVALTLVVPTPATLGYDSLGFCVVEKVNGKRVTSLASFAEQLDSPTDDGIIELTINRAPYNIYFDRQTVEASNDAIRRRAIPRLRRIEQGADAQ